MNFSAFLPRSLLSQRCVALFNSGRSSVQLGRVCRGDPSKRTISSSTLAARTSASSPQARLSLISRHLYHRPLLEINTPFSTERQSDRQDDLLYTPLIREIPADLYGSHSTTSQPKQSKQSKQSKETPSNMSSQPEHPTLLIPGPIEFDDEVLQAMGHYSESHVGQGFVNTFGEALTKLRSLFQTKSTESQPFVVSGSGTLGWDMVAANLVERGDEVLVLHTGYFADSFADCFSIYGISATQLKAPIGGRPSLEDISGALKKQKYKLITITHVDTSTGVLSDVQQIAKLVHAESPDTLIVVDGVCSVGSEEIQFDEWGLDAVLTASQKGIGVPAGLSIVMCSGRAMAAFKARNSPPASYFGSFANWLPIMQNYENKKPSYFATPSPQLIHALHTSLNQILSKPLSARFEAQKKASQRVKTKIADLGLKQLATDPQCQANGMTAFWLPEGLTPAQVMPELINRGVVLAGGLHKEVATKYMRFGHMGASAVDPRRSADLDKAFTALSEALVACGYKPSK